MLNPEFIDKNKCIKSIENNSYRELLLISQNIIVILL